METRRFCLLLLLFSTIICVKHGSGQDAEACPNLEYEFNNAGDKEYLELVDPIPIMEYFTICAKVTTDQSGIVPGAVASYATSDGVDILGAYGQAANGVSVLKVAVNGEVQALETPLAPNTEYSFCLKYDLPEGYVYTYINGGLMLQVAYKARGIPAGGKVIVGQRQECYKARGACFEKAMAFSGKIRDFNIWNRMLTNAEIAGFAVKNKCPNDAIATTSPHRVLPTGKFYTYEACPSTEFNLNNVGTSVQYVELTKYAGFTEYFTTCAKATTDQHGAISGTVGSYAIQGQPNTLSSRGEIFNNIPHMRVAVNGQSGLLVARLAPNTEYAFCFVYQLPRDRVFSYINGHSVADVAYSKLGSVLPGGKVIIGQQQTCLGGCFDRNHAFNGKVRNFMTWGRALSAEEMKDYSTSDQCPTDHYIDLTSNNARFVSESL